MVSLQGEQEFKGGLVLGVDPVSQAVEEVAFSLYRQRVGKSIFCYSFCFHFCNYLSVCGTDGHFHEIIVTFDTQRSI